MDCLECTAILSRHILGGPPVGSLVLMSDPPSCFAPLLAPQAGLAALIL